MVLPVWRGQRSWKTLLPGCGLPFPCLEPVSVKHRRQGQVAAKLSFLPCHRPALGWELRVWLFVVLALRIRSLLSIVYFPTCPRAQIAGLGLGVFTAVLLPHPMKLCEVGKSTTHAKKALCLSPVSFQSSVHQSLHLASFPQQNKAPPSLPWSWQCPWAAGLFGVGSPLDSVGRWTQPCPGGGLPNGAVPALLVLLPLSLLMIK